MYRNAFGEDSERLFSAEFAVQIFMDLSLCSAVPVARAVVRAAAHCDLARGCQKLLFV